MNSVDSLRARRDDILRMAIRHGAHNVRVFGSVARGEATEDSDVDFLVSTSEGTSPWFPAGLVVDLEDLLGCRAQVVTEEGLYGLLRERILREARPLQRGPVLKSGFSRCRPAAGGFECGCRRTRPPPRAPTRTQFPADWRSATRPATRGAVVCRV